MVSPQPQAVTSILSVQLDLSRATPSGAVDVRAARASAQRQPALAAASATANSAGGSLSAAKYATRVQKPESTKLG
jgi:hypothetical protein